MIRNSIVAKLWLTIVAMVVVVLALLSVLLQQFLDHYIYQQQSRQLVRIAQSVQILVNNGETPSTAAQVAQKLTSVQKAHVQVIIAEPIAQNKQLNSEYQHHFTASQKHQFQSGQPVTIHIRAKDRNPEHDSINVYLRISHAKTVGMLEVSQKMSALHAPITLMRNLIVFSVGLSILFTTALAFVLSKNISRPLVQMNKVAEEMADGNFRGKIRVVTTDEVGRLGRTFNTLVSQLDHTIAALSREKEQLSSILSSLNDGVVAADLEGSVTLANPPAVRRFIPLMDPDSDGEIRKLPADLAQLMSSVISKRGPVTRELTWTGREMLVTMTPLYESDGEQIRGVVSVQRDITEERRLDRLRKDFIANVSHELRTPLSMMQGYSEALLDDFGDDREQRIELSEIIHDEAIRMKRLVNDLLNLAQLESGHFQMSMNELNLVQFSERVARKFHAMAQDERITLKLDMAERDIMILGDADRMEQVLTNLMDNAIRHTPENGMVTLRVQAIEAHALIQVKDTGSGISPEDLPYIWERFYKADKSRTRGQGKSGTGLGLAITRYIVLEHGGDIAANSSPEDGTTFTISIPLLGHFIPAKNDGG
ncbi:ATP-binding protein [Alicyclobacillus sp. SO9]|uniref:ATP-binding protein n=1 Tax=Alicyclobacillus sp. SO9 TaxID=2665646 RepID=UPI0018E80FD9|nr:ATP-binding protein [Alicyclobacillus sp. SO9]QQE76898.1 HAMP domain-containing protein [Alicyclobacillus sp. SO9]